MSEGRQTCIFDVLFVDSFAGGGGASTGIEMATGHPVDIAINHDESAIMMHKRNHPYTEHYREDIWQVDPVKATHGQKVRLAWFSPDCKHFSRAKGAALVDRHIRGLAWVVLRWAGTVRPDVIMLENVPEFVTWGPVRKGKPIRSKAGQTYRKWHKQLEDLGYRIESRELCAADYGAPTIRTRFCLIARRDGQPIVWPARTHAPRDSEAVRSGRCKAWRSAAEIIDWTLPCPSIFATKAEIKRKYGLNAVRPLADNTLRRIIRGVDKFTIRSGKPFIVPTGYGERKGQAPRIHDIDAPVPTLVSTVKHNVCEPMIAPVTFSNTCNSVGAPANQPIYTVRTGGGGGQLLSTAQLIQYHTEQAGNARAAGLDAPIHTVDASNRYGLVSAQMVEYYGASQRGFDIADPTHTATSHDREALTTVIMQPFHAGGYQGKGNSPEEPVNTITASGSQTLVCSHIAEFKGQDVGQDARNPLRTVTAGGGEFAAVRTIVARYDGNANLRHWPDVRALLNRYCRYALADDEVLLISVGGHWYYIADIGLRMLTPRELYDAMGFPHDYIIDKDVTGRPISKTDQVARCGNAVCPAVSEAMVRANLPECAKQRYGTMDEMHEAMSS